MLRPRGGFSDENVVEKAQVKNLITNGNLVTTYKNLWKWLLELDGIMVKYECNFICMRDKIESENFNFLLLIKM